jgi:hypothetical protein
MTEPSNKKKGLQDNKQLPVEVSDAEQCLMEQGRQKLLSYRVPFKNGKPAPIDGKEVLLSFAMLMDTCQTADANVALRTVCNAAAGQVYGDQDADLELALAQMTELNPQSPLEALLVSQMIAVNTAVGKVMTRAMAKDQRLDFQERNINLATKLQRTFLQQIDSLQKLRGKGQQKVTVEHVHVHQGGQAVVGNIENPGDRGEGNNGKP